MIEVQHFNCHSLLVDIEDYGRPWLFAVEDLVTMAEAVCSPQTQDYID